MELYEKTGNAQLAREIDAALPIELSREEQIRLVREYCSSQFVSRGMCVDFAIHDTDSAATPIVISCLLCAPLTSAAHGRRSPKRNMTLTRTASAYAYQAADTRHTKLTSQAGTTRATRFYGARHGRIFQMPTLNAPDARSVSTTAVTPSAALTSCLPSTWA